MYTFYLSTIHLLTLLFQAAVQSAKDHANAQVTPVHITNVLLNEGDSKGEQSAGASLLASAISKAGGDVVSMM
jgi:hypothetical protein